MSRLLSLGYGVLPFVVCAIACDDPGAGPIQSVGGSVTSGGTPGFSGGDGSGGRTGLASGGDAASGGGAGGTGQEASGGVGSVASGGDPGDGGSSQAGGTSGFEGTFELLFRDDFDALDESRWQLMTHSWETNLALFSSESVSVEGGEMSITILEAPPGTTDGNDEKPYLGAEVRSVDTLTYGRVKARAKLAKGSAVVSSLVTIYTPWPADNWNELDVECLGKDPNEVQFNAMVYTGALPATNLPVSPTQDAEMYSLGFDASTEFHEYTIEWTPESARFLVDGALAREWSSRISLMNLPQNILLTIWASSSASWAGAVDGTTVGARAVYDWVEVYTYK